MCRIRSKWAHRRLRKCLPIAITIAIVLAVMLGGCHGARSLGMHETVDAAITLVFPDFSNNAAGEIRCSPDPDDHTRKVAWLTVADAEGAYTIPYIQSGGTLRLSLAFHDVNLAKMKVLLMRGESIVSRGSVTPPESRISFWDLPPGEYDLQACALDKAGRTCAETVYGRVGIGTVIAAIGDSITEGYYGRGFLQDTLVLKASLFPADAVSKDGRNFPQFAPTTRQHMPSVNCFESWMTRLNDSLADAWRHPVFIANEGWGGITSGGYLEMARTNTNWQERMRLLKPQLWLIHLGVNDERGKIPAETFARNIENLVNLLIQGHGAAPERILLAKPCYDYFEGAREYLEPYNKEIERLIRHRGLGRGPDFFTAYAADQKRWYGEDPVHPNTAGMDHMADLWHQAIVAAFPAGIPCSPAKSDS